MSAWEYAYDEEEKTGAAKPEKKTSKEWGVVMYEDAQDAEVPEEEERRAPPRTK